MLPTVDAAGPGPRWYRRPMAGTELDEIGQFTVGQRRRAGLRLIAVGLVAIAPAVAFALYTGTLSSEPPYTRWRIFSGLLALVGAILTALGAVTLARARAGIDPAVPAARAVVRRD